jgi:hypothetical protein
VCIHIGPHPAPAVEIHQRRNNPVSRWPKHPAEDPPPAPALQ